MAQRNGTVNRKHSYNAARRPAVSKSAGPSSGLKDGENSLREGMQCGICLRERARRDFPRLYVTEIPGYPLGAPRHTFARVLICRTCWNQARTQDSRTDIEVARLFDWTR
jgi:hypothetical protein